MLNKKPHSLIEMSLDHEAGFVKSETTTQDEFLGGKIRISQPKAGFRAGSDSVLLGASVASKGQFLLDMGSGVGTAACVALTHNSHLHATLAENNAEIFPLINNNFTENNFADRAELIDIDIAASGAVRAAAGLKTDHYSSVICNPPYFHAQNGTNAKGAGRAKARHMHEGDLDLWVRAAAACAAPQGEAIFIYRADGLSDLLDAFKNRFGAISILPIAAKQGQDASRILVRGRKGSRAPLIIKSPLILHENSGGTYLPQIDAIFRGEKQLDW